MSLFSVASIPPSEPLSLLLLRRHDVLSEDHPSLPPSLPFFLPLRYICPFGYSSSRLLASAPRTRRCPDISDGAVRRRCRARWSSDFPSHPCDRERPPPPPPGWTRAGCPPRPPDNPTIDVSLGCPFIVVRGAPFRPPSSPAFSRRPGGAGGGRDETHQSDGTSREEVRGRCRPARITRPDGHHRRFSRLKAKKRIGDSEGSLVPVGWILFM